MNRALLTPRWLLLHALFLAAAVATGLLAWWQWDRAHDAGGSFQNLGYALQWPLFGVFTLCLWFWLIRMESQRGGRAPDAEAVSPAAPEEPVQVTTTRNRRLVPPPAPPVDPDEDPELAEYNRYLAELDEADRNAGPERKSGPDRKTGPDRKAG